MAEEQNRKIEEKLARIPQILDSKLGEPFTTLEICRNLEMIAYQAVVEEECIRLMHDEIIRGKEIEIDTWDKFTCGRYHWVWWTR